MADQRIADARWPRAGRSTRTSPSTRRATRSLAEVGRPQSWRPFQLAFILMQLAAADRPGGAEARRGDLAKVELLFFPTGGGKTEAYLGLAAYTFAIRRLQGVVETAGRRRSTARDGVAVLMRYTLRLLTAQQFQRATALVCAAELARPRRRGHAGAPSRSGSGCGSGPTSARSGSRRPTSSSSEPRRRVGALPADRAADPALPVVRHADRRRRNVKADADRAAGLRVLRRRARPTARSPRAARSPRGCRC